MLRVIQVYSARKWKSWDRNPGQATRSEPESCHPSHRDVMFTTSKASQGPLLSSVVITIFLECKDFKWAVAWKGPWWSNKPSSSHPVTPHIPLLESTLQWVLGSTVIGQHSTKRHLVSGKEAGKPVWAKQEWEVGRKHAFCGRGWLTSPHRTVAGKGVPALRRLCTCA